VPALSVRKNKLPLGKPIDPSGRLDRALRIAVHLLDRDIDADADTLCQAFHVSRRTLHRDLALLRRNGIHIEYRRKGDRFHLATLGGQIAHHLTRAEARAFLQWAEKQARRETAAVGDASLESALNKLIDIVRSQSEEDPPVLPSRKNRSHSLIR